MLSDQMRKEQYSDYIGDNLYTIWELVLKSEFTSLSYDNHIYAMYSNDGGTSMVLIYSPIEERFVGFSLKILKRLSSERFMCREFSAASILCF